MVKVKTHGFCICGSPLSLHQRAYCSGKCRDSVYYQNKKKRASTEDQLVRTRLSSIRTRTRRKGLPETNLTIELVKEIINSHCIYCNAPPRSEIDRKDPMLGYTIDNVVPACRRCNTLKNNVVTYDEMMKIADILGWSA